MKKILTIALLLNIFTVLVYSQEVWTKLGDNIYINYKSMKKEHGGRIAWFKIIQPQESTYKLEKYKVYCKSGIIEVKHTKLYDSSNNLLDEEINNRNIGCSYDGIVNGEIYYKALCKRNKI